MTQIDTKTAVGNLLMKASGNPIATKVLTKFDADASRTLNIRSLSSFKVEMLERCAEFLCIELDDDDSNKLYTKDTLISRILMGIRSHLPSKCNECNFSYCVELDSHEAPFRCFMCYQGSHDCKEIRDKKKAMSEAALDLPVGHVWLCFACHKSSDPYKPRKSRSRHNSVTIKEPNSKKAAETDTDTDTGFAVDSKSQSNDDLKPNQSKNICPDYRRGKY